LFPLAAPDTPSNAAKALETTMTIRNRLLESDYPRRIPIARYIPARRDFPLADWDPRNVQVAADLPPYLILGQLDEATFQRTEVGWSARWVGVDPGTWFFVTWHSKDAHYEIRQSWQGIEGPCGHYDSHISLDRIIGLMLYHRFPDSWESAAQQRLEAQYQLTYIPQASVSSAPIGIPDGALRHIVFPFPVFALRRYARALRKWLESWALPYPVTVEARLLFNVVNYVEGKAPAWTCHPAVVGKHCLEEMHVPTCGVPVREVAANGSAAWTLRRELYYIFIGVPFAGLTDLLARLRADGGMIRSVDDPELRFELRPFILPAGFESPAREFSVMDVKTGATRHFVKFPEAGESGGEPAIEEWQDIGQRCEALVSQAEQCTEDFCRKALADVHD
jgi:hypothetical protein